MPGALVVPMPVLVERVNLHWPLSVSVWLGDQGKYPVGVAEKGVWGRQELMLEEAQEWRAPWPYLCPPWSLSTAQGLLSAYGALLPPRSRCLPMELIHRWWWQILRRETNAEERLGYHPLLGGRLAPGQVRPGCPHSWASSNPGFNLPQTCFPATSGGPVFDTQPHIDQHPSASEGFHAQQGPALGQPGHWACHPLTMSG